MKLLKTVLLFLFLFAFIASFVYAAFSFGAASFDIKTWSDEARTMCAAMGFITGFIVAAFGSFFYYADCELN